MIGPDTVPVKSSVDFCENDAGVALLIPRYPTAVGKMVGRLLKRSSHIKVKLDGLGSAVWKLIDGVRTVEEIGGQIRGIFGSDAEPLYPRLVEFLEILCRNKFITLKECCEVENVGQGRA